VRPWLKRSLVGVVAVPLVGAAVLAVEVQVARDGRNLPNRPPFRLDGRIGPATGPAVHLVWLGDSTAAGMGASTPDDALPRVVAHELVAGGSPPIDLTSLAVSGATVADVLHQQVGHVPVDADLVVIDIGSNDVTHLTSRSAFRSHYTEVLDRLPKRTKVVLLGVPDLGSPTRLPQPLRFIAGVRGGTLDAVVQALARKRHLGYVDIAGSTGPAFRRHPAKYLSADHYHPSDAGYRLWAAAVVLVVRGALRG
jgi:lysophospholipase L1-like esterase